ncbi:hypothetical protein ABH940_006845 [Streptacidiphilus sp. BW17]|uniref:hypothetical protein n=1 Tax=Streptacidiphilus sp. BW17 TaxID=3156274 RepID=UPI003513445E
MAWKNTKQPSPTAAVPKLNDDRLCWLAIRDHIDKHSRKLGFWGWLSTLAGASGGGRGVGGGAGGAVRMGGDMRRESMSDKKLDYAVAVDAASEQLTHQERPHLRATGQIPDWFVDDVEQRVAALRKQHR